MRSKRHSETLQKLTLVGFAAALMGTAAFVPSSAMANPLPNCAGLAAQLLKNRDILSATSAVQAAAGGNLSYCLVNITVSDLAGPAAGYLPGQKQMIEIGVGLPLSTADGGSVGVHGNWNGRIQDLGGGGYAGAVGPVTGATNFGYVGSSTDTGHESATGSGAFALNPNDTLNWGLIRDFAFNGIHEQAIWTKSLTQMYYGQGPKYTYWNGCSTGGRQGHEQAQMYPDDFDGILAGSPAVNFDRLSAAQQWGEVVMNQEVGAPIAQSKLDAVSQAAVADCDSLDGIADGIIQDPRACHVDAKTYACGAPGGKALGANCLTPQEADSVNKIWNGIFLPSVPVAASIEPSSGRTSRLWFGEARGTSLGILDGATSFFIPVQWLQFWVFQNPAFNWQTLTETTFDGAFLEGDNKFHQVIATDNPDLSAFKSHGGKMITYHGLADGIIMPLGTYNYYNRVTQAQGNLAATQSFYRFFPYPGNGHCGAASLGGAFQTNAALIDFTTPGGLFQALVNWVEHGVAPDTIIATNSTGGTRPICMYPDTLKYNGTGPLFSASSFTCQHRTIDPLTSAEDALPDPLAQGFSHGF
jgi:Tannase and feruloyl esterase